LPHVIFEWGLSILLAVIVLLGLAVETTPRNICLLVVASALLVWLMARSLGLAGGKGSAVPINYKALEISDEAITYTDLIDRVELIRFADITRLAYVREEAAFPDFDGPYIESKWVIRTREHFYLEVMDERPHRAALIASFQRHMSAFDEGALAAGLAASGEGEWQCFRSPDCRDSPGE
jgi:hypothetical protein